MSAVPAIVVLLLLTAIYIGFLHRRYGNLLAEKSHTIEQLIVLLGGVVNAEAEVTDALAAAREEDR